MLITFLPHPTAVLLPERKPRLLSTRRQKLHLLAETGLDQALLLEFNAEMAAL